MTPRKKGKAARTRYMMADFTPAEKDRILDHCAQQGTTISTFLATLALEEVHRSSRAAPEEEELEVTLKLPVEESAKLQMFAHRRGESVNQYMREMLIPLLAKGRTSFNNPQIESLRYYVSPEEHRLLTRYFKSKRLSPRTYVSYLALKALKQHGKRSRKK